MVLGNMVEMSNEVHQQSIIIQIGVVYHPE